MAGEILLEVDWPTTTLGQVVKNFDSKRVPLSSRERLLRQGKYPYYGAAGCIDHVDDYLFEGLHLLIGEDGSVIRPDGRPFLQLVNGKFWVNNHAHVLRGEDETETKFLFYALETCNVSGMITGAVQPKITQANLNSIRFSYPPRKAREKIVRVLGTLDDKIELNRRMNETLEGIAGALFQSWFVDFDPVRAKLDGRQPAGMDAETAALFPAEFQESPLGLIPKGWSVEHVGHVVECVGGGTPSTAEPKYWDGGVHHWTTPKDFSSLQAPILLDTDRKLTDAGIAKISSGLLPAGTLLLSSRAPVGYLAIAAMPVAINQGFIAMKCNDRASNYFMLNWCRVNMAEIEGRATGTTFAEISKQNFRPIPVILPTIEIMAAFTNAVEPFFKQITENLKQTRTLAVLRDTLLPKLLNGELRVEAAEREFSEATCKVSLHVPRKGDREVGA